MENKFVLVSIIIPTYNRFSLLGETLDSVLSQSYPNWECLVVDDGSTDYTIEIMEFYCNRDRRIRFYRRPDEMPKGANSCRNYGFSLSKGEFINFLDSDDLFSENKISDQIQLLLANDADLATCKWGRFLKVDFNLKELSINKNYSSGLELIEDYGNKREFFPSHSFLIKRSIIHSAGGWNSYLQVNQDGEFFVRLLIHVKEIVFSENSFVLYRIPEKTNTSLILSRGKALHLVLSWKLIDSYLNVIDPERFKEYIALGKSYCCGKLFKDYNSILKENKTFFMDELKSYSIFNRLKKRIFN